MDSPPAKLSMADLLRLADAFPLMDRLAILVAARTRGDRPAVIFGIVDGLRGHLDATTPADGPQRVEETIEVIRVWFYDRIADEEARAADVRRDEQRHGRSA